MRKLLTAVSLTALAMSAITANAQNGTSLSFPAYSTNNTFFGGPVVGEQAALGPLLERSGFYNLLNFSVIKPGTIQANGVLAGLYTGPGAPSNPTTIVQNVSFSPVLFNGTCPSVTVPIGPINTTMFGQPETINQILLSATAFARIGDSLGSLICQLDGLSAQAKGDLPGATLANQILGVMEGTGSVQSALSMPVWTTSVVSSQANFSLQSFSMPVPGTMYANGVVSGFAYPNFSYSQNVSIPLNAFTNATCPNLTVNIPATLFLSGGGPLPVNTFPIVMNLSPFAGQGDALGAQICQFDQLLARNPKDNQLAVTLNQILATLEGQPQM